MVDMLKGSKEYVIVGHKIPSYQMPSYSRLKITLPFGADLPIKEMIVVTGAG